MRSSLRYISAFLFVVVLIASGCRKTSELIDFTEEDEVLLGEKLAQAISEDISFNILSRDNHTIPYGYADSRLTELTSSSAITKSEDFSWTISLLEDDLRQAFALPGGHLYVSTGMIFYLENEDQFSGILAHLISHIDQSHITEALFFKYGVNNLRAIANAGDQETLRSIVGDLDLTNDFILFSRANEAQADTLAISLLAETDQSCESGGLYFFRTLNVQPDQISAFINAHRVTDLRVSDINEMANEIGCDTSIDGESATRYRSFRNSLP